MSGKRKYFGTDGIRGAVGTHPITAEFMLKLGWAAGRVLAKEGGGKVVIGKDTRISGYMFESALEAGLSAAGVNTALLGPMPTPAIAYLTRTLHAQAGIVISASHNAFFDNGVKFFSGDGKKLPDPVELEIEQELDQPMRTVTSRELGKAVRVSDVEGRYIEFCKGSFPNNQSLRGLKIVVDCANGATYKVAPSVFDELGAEVVAVASEPNGININEDCGATRPQNLRAEVLKQGADVGVALDGDGDRLIMVDHNGEVVDGDEVLFIIARSQHQRGLLQGAVVGTQMTNLGLEVALRDLGVPLERTQVGDRYIIERLEQGGSNLGGESSGHIICRDRTTTGDGIVAALQVLGAMRTEDKSLQELKNGMRKFPQSLVNVRMAERVNVLELQGVKDAVAQAESELGDRGRVLMRLSGTEPLARVMVEGEDPNQVKTLAERLAGVVEETLARPE